MVYLESDVICLVSQSCSFVEWAKRRKHICLVARILIEFDSRNVNNRIWILCIKCILNVECWWLVAVVNACLVVCYWDFSYLLMYLCVIIIFCNRTRFFLSQRKLTPIGSIRRCQQCLVLEVWSAPNNEVFIKSPDFK